MGEQMPIKKTGPTPDTTLSIAQIARKEAIQKLQKSLGDSNSKMTEVVRKARINALITLLESEAKEIHGELTTDEHLHFSTDYPNDSAILDTSSTESENEKRAESVS